MQKAAPPSSSSFSLTRDDVVFLRRQQRQFPSPHQYRHQPHQPNHRGHRNATIHRNRSFFGWLDERPDSPGKLELKRDIGRDHSERWHPTRPRNRREHWHNPNHGKFCARLQQCDGIHGFNRHTLEFSARLCHGFCHVASPLNVKAAPPFLELCSRGLDGASA